MFKTKRNIILATASCALLLPIAVSAKKPAEQRALNFHGDCTAIMMEGNPTTISGEGTHFGRFVGGGSSGSMWLQSTQGDMLYWDIVVRSMTFYPDGTVEIVVDATITGGTGRFEGATGYFVCVHHGTVDWPTLTLTIPWTAEGRMTY